MSLLVLEELQSKCSVVPFLKLCMSMLFALERPYHTCKSIHDHINKWKQVENTCSARSNQQRKFYDDPWSFSEWALKRWNENSRATHRHRFWSGFQMRICRRRSQMLANIRLVCSRSCECDGVIKQKNGVQMPMAGTTQGKRELGAWTQARLLVRKKTRLARMRAPLVHVSHAERASAEQPC